MAEHEELTRKIHRICEGHVGNHILAACTDMLLAMMEKEIRANKITALAYLELMLNEFAHRCSISSMDVLHEVHNLRENALSKIPTDPDKFSQFR